MPFWRSKKSEKSLSPDSASDSAKSQSQLSMASTLVPASATSKNKKEEEDEDTQKERVVAPDFLRRGILPDHAEQIAKLPADHPVHKIPLDEQGDMIRRRINPVTKAEMQDLMANAKKGGRFNVKAGSDWGSGLMACSGF